MLHRLAESQIDAERQRRDELGQSNAALILIGTHINARGYDATPDSRC
jgi:hypothetical protein